jgi:hypothetical protein
MSKRKIELKTTCSTSIIRSGWSMVQRNPTAERR